MLDDMQPKTGIPSIAFRRIKGLKNFRERFFCHALPIIAIMDKDAIGLLLNLNNDRSLFIGLKSVRECIDDNISNNLRINSGAALSFQVIRAAHRQNDVSFFSSGGKS